MNNKKYSSGFETKGQKQSHSSYLFILLLFAFAIITTIPSYAKLFATSIDIPKLISSQSAYPSFLTSIFNKDIKKEIWGKNAPRKDDEEGWQHSYYLARSSSLGFVPVENSPNPIPQKYKPDAPVKPEKFAACPEPTTTTSPVVYKGCYGESGVWICTLNADGTGYTQVLAVGGWGQPRWSRDATQIYHTNYNIGGLSRMNADGTGLTLIYGGIFGGTHARISSDGSMIAVEAPNDDDIIRMKTDGTNVISLATTGGNRRPEWSPDGTKIAFQSSRTGLWQIYTMNIDGTNQTQLTFAGTNERPRWSPDGTKICFHSNRDAPGNWEVYKMNADGSGQFRITQFVDPPNVWSDYNPRFINDSTKLVYLSTRTGVLTLYRINEDGTGDTPVVTDIAGSTGQRWAPDLNKIIVIRALAQWDIWTVDYDTFAAVNITNSPAQEADWKWGGSWILDSY